MSPEPAIRATYQHLVDLGGRNPPRRAEPGLSPEQARLNSNQLMASNAPDLTFLGHTLQLCWRPRRADLRGRASHHRGKPPAAEPCWLAALTPSQGFVMACGHSRLRTPNLTCMKPCRPCRSRSGTGPRLPDCRAASVYNA